MAIFSLFCSVGKGNADSDLLELDESGFALFLDVADSRATFITCYKSCAWLIRRVTSDISHVQGNL